MRDEYSIEMVPDVRRVVSGLDLIQSAGSITFEISGIEMHANSGYMFEVRAPGYRLAVGVIRGQLVIERNDQRTAISVPRTHNPVKNFAMWSPSFISVFADAPAETGPLSEREVEEATVRVLSEPPVFPPTGLIGWARREALAPRTIYGTTSEAINAAMTALVGLQDKIQSQGMQYAFWDFTREGQRIVARRPKDETELHPTLAGLLHDAALIRNFEIIRERPTGGGDLDFSIVLPVSERGPAQVCAEFKKAHSDGLVHGLTQQLPNYMRSQGADFGVYGVLWFKGKYFDQPRDPESPKHLPVDLAIEAERRGVRDVRVLVIDVSFGSPPSER